MCATSLEADWKRKILGGGLGGEDLRSRINRAGWCGWAGWAAGLGGLGCGRVAAGRLAAGLGWAGLRWAWAAGLGGWGCGSTGGYHRPPTEGGPWSLTADKAPWQFVRACAPRCREGGSAAGYHRPPKGGGRWYSSVANVSCAPVCGVVGGRSGEGYHVLLRGEEHGTPL